MPKNVENKVVLHRLSKAELLELITSNKMEIQNWEIKIKKTEEEIKKLNDEISKLDNAKNLNPSERERIKEKRIQEIKKEILATEYEIRNESQRKMLALEKSSSCKEEVLKEMTVSERMFSDWVRRKQNKTEPVTNHSLESETEKYYLNKLRNLESKLYALEDERLRLNQNDPFWFMEMDEKDEKDREIKLRQLKDLKKKSNDIKNKISEKEDENHKIKEIIEYREKDIIYPINNDKSEPLSHQLGIVKP